MLIYQQNDQVLIACTSDKKVYVHCNDSIVSYTHQKDDEQWMLYCVTSKGDVLRIGELEILKRASDTSCSVEENVEIFEDLLRVEEDKDHTIELKLSTQLVANLNDADALIASKENNKTIGISVCADFVILQKLNNTLEVYKTSVHSEHVTLLLPKLKDFQSRCIGSMIVKILTCDSENCGLSYSPDVIRISETLFRELFGENIMLTSLSVILVSPYDGSNSLWSTVLPATIENGENDFLSEVENKNVCKWNTLCQMSSCVVEITSIAFEIDSSTNHGSALCICSQDGHVTVFHCGKSNPKCVVSELHVCSPVLTMCSFNNRLYHSTGNQLIESKCVLNQNETDQNLYGRLTVKSKILNETNVTKLFVSTPEGYTISLDSPCCLHCVLLNKEVKSLTVPLDENDKKSTPVYRQENIRDILTSMNSISRKKDSLMKQNDIQTQFIQQLNIASFLIKFYLKSYSNFDDSGRFITSTDACTKSRNCPFQLNFVVQGETCHMDKDFMVECELTNKMPINISHDWIIGVSLLPIDGGGACITVSKKLKSDWKHGEKLNISIPITYRQCLAGCKLIIKATFLGDEFVKHFSEVCNQDGTTSDFEKCSKSILGDEMCVSIPVLEKELDIIHCLQPDLKYTKMSEIQSTRSMCYLTELAGKRMLLDQTVSDMSPSTVCTQNIVKLSSNMDILKSDASISLHDFFGEHLVEEADLESGGCHLRSLDGHSVHMSFRKIDGHITDAPGDVKVRKKTLGNHCDWEVTVRSSPELAAAVHKALNRRQCALMNHCGTNEDEMLVSIAYKKLANIKEAISQLQDYIHGTRSDEYKNISLIFEKLRNVKV